MIYNGLQLYWLNLENNQCAIGPKLAKYLGELYI